MSRSDLDRIQAGLKVAIQTHQLLVAKMKADPQNSGLQQQLHELQSQITSLSEKQKMVVQLLKKELVIKPSQPSPTTASTLQTPMPAHIKVMSHVGVPPNLQMDSVKQLPLLAPKPVNQPTAQPGVTVNAQSQGANLGMESHNGGLLNNNNKSVLSENVPEVSHMPNAAPLKVPQFRSSRPSILQNTSQAAEATVTPSPLVPVSIRVVADPEPSTVKKFLVHKDATPDERKKLMFMASLELVTPEAVKEFQNRRSERKRRSTANPQFSYTDFEPEYKRKTVTYLSQTPVLLGARKRGRPPKNCTSLEASSIQLLSNKE